jgi:hypothetical protein
MTEMGSVFLIRAFSTDHRYLPRRRSEIRIRRSTTKSEAAVSFCPGKLTQLETFRVGCIGAIGPENAPGGECRARQLAALG